MNELKESQHPPVDITRVKHIHFVGIGGAGMGGIAEVLLDQGYRISGSDVNANEMTQRLKKMGALISHGHAAKHINDADMVVFSSAVTADNPELVAANQANIPVLQRAQMLAELMRFKQGIAIAGTHGKTTTTGLMTQILLEAGLDPTFIIGGLLKNANTNARAGKGAHLVAEADESDASFLCLHPQIAIVTNIDADHMSTYGDDFSKLRQTFLQFLHRLPETGLAVLCGDDPEVHACLADIHRPKQIYGFETHFDIYASDVEYQGTQCHFNVWIKGREQSLPIVLNIPGRHNVLNALAVIAVAVHLNISDESIKTALLQFQGMGRRFQIHGELSLKDQGCALLVDDYGHHPREISVTLDAVRKVWPNRRLVMVYQPHRYSRTSELFGDFVKILAEVDVLVLLDVYSAGEDFIPGADGQSLFNAINQQHNALPATYVPDLKQLPQVLNTVLQADDILLLQGAGDIGQMAAQLAAQGLSSKGLS
jgi:UDP-N-acetylmuramate--alanine ligase